jgi:hypothetical protein
MLLVGGAVVTLGVRTDSHLHCLYVSICACCCLVSVLELLLYRFGQNAKTVESWSTHMGYKLANELEVRFFSITHELS